MLKRNRKAQAPISSLEDYQFHIDIVSDKVIAGWAINKNSPETAPKVEVVTGSQVLWHSFANQARDDLKEAGLGNAAFSITPNQSVLKKDIDAVDILIDGHKVSAESFPLSLRLLKLEDYVCQFDASNENSVLGWARNIQSDTHRVRVELKQDGAVLASGVADLYRDDLKEAGFGGGVHGFNLKVHLANFKQCQAVCQVFLDGMQTKFNPVELNVSEEAIARAKFMAEFGSELQSFEQLHSEERARIQTQIDQLQSATEQLSLQSVINLVAENLAELSSRTSLIERVIVKQSGD